MTIRANKYTPPDLCINSSPSTFLDKSRNTFILFRTFKMMEMKERRISVPPALYTFAAKLISYKTLSLLVGHFSPRVSNMGIVSTWTASKTKLAAGNSNTNSILNDEPRNFNPTSRTHLSQNKYLRSISILKRTCLLYNLKTSRARTTKKGRVNGLLHRFIYEDEKSRYRICVRRVTSIFIERGC